MTTDLWLRSIKFDGAVVAATSPDTLALRVPSCPDWTVRDLIIHLGAVHRWAATFLALDPGSRERVPFDTSDVPDGPALTAWYRDRLAELVAQLERTSPESRVRSFLGLGDARFWFRRQAHETSIHRWDVENALPSGPAPVATDLAVDGVGEWLDVFAPRFLARGPGLPTELVGRSVLLAAADADASWLVSLDERGVTLGADASPDVVVHGSASDLILALWRRAPLSRLTVDGDVEVVTGLLDAVQVT